VTIALRVSLLLWDLHSSFQQSAAKVVCMGRAQCLESARATKVTQAQSVLSVCIHFLLFLTRQPCALPVSTVNAVLLVSARATRDGREAAVLKVGFIRLSFLNHPAICTEGCTYGDCKVPAACDCFTGWEGPTCKSPACLPKCKNGQCIRTMSYNASRMVFTHECQCQTGWTGIDCGTRKES
jgi:hypothetical protein